MPTLSFRASATFAAHLRTLAGDTPMNAFLTRVLTEATGYETPPPGAPRGVDMARLVPCLPCETPLDIAVQPVPLTQAQHAFVSLTDAPRVQEARWHYDSGAKRAVRSVPGDDGRHRKQPLERLVTGLPATVRIYFKDGNRLNCTRGNLLRLPTKEDADAR